MHKLFAVFKTEIHQSDMFECSSVNYDSLKTIYHISMIPTLLPKMNYFELNTVISEILTVKIHA